MKRQRVGALFFLVMTALSAARAWAGDATILVKGWPPPKGQVFGYNLYMSATESGPWDKANTTPILAPEYSVKGLELGQRYYFRLAALNGAAGSKLVESAPSATWSLMAGGAEAASQGAAVSLEGELHLGGWFWLPEGYDSRPPVYQLLLAESPEGPFRVMNKKPITRGYYTVRGLVPGRTYYVKLKDESARDWSLQNVSRGWSGVHKGVAELPPKATPWSTAQKAFRGLDFDDASQAGLYTAADQMRASQVQASYERGAKPGEGRVKIHAQIAPGSWGLFLAEVRPADACAVSAGSAKELAVWVFTKHPGVSLGLGYQEKAPGETSSEVWRSKFQSLQGGKWERVAFPLASLKEDTDNTDCAPYCFRQGNNRQDSDCIAHFFIFLGRNDQPYDVVADNLHFE